VTARPAPIVLLALLAMPALLLPAGCRRTTGPAASRPAPPVEKTAERGPVKLVVRADRGRITIAERLGLAIGVVAEAGVDVDMPSFGDKLNEFEIMDFRERSAVPESPAGGKPSRRWTQEYTLESFLSGDLEIPPITVKFHDRRDPARSVEGEVVSEPLHVEVTSLLAGEFNPARYRDIKGTVELPADRGRAWLWWAAGGAGTLVVLLGAGWLLRRRVRRAAVPRPIPPHEWAFFALQRLEEDQLVESGRVQEFYFRLSAIVREYIERRFGLMAPERTTPEFLVEVRGHAALSGAQKRLLGEFLEAADMVKFARYEPAAGEVRGAFGTARAFVDQTTPERAGEEAAGATGGPGAAIAAGGEAKA
jgi:hypothetical protein